MSGCATTGTVRGVTVWTAPTGFGISEDRIDTVIDITLDEFEKATGCRPSEAQIAAVRTITFTVYPTYCSSGRCYGQVDHSTGAMWVMIRGGSIGASSLAHEYIHVFAAACGISDLDHSDTRLFMKSPGPTEDTAEYKAKYRAVRELFR